LDENGFYRTGASPIKDKSHLAGYDISNAIYSHIWNGIVLVRKSETTNDYSFYVEAQDILLSRFDKSQFIFTYTNYKESALLSGLGYRAKNSLIYSRKFGFQSKICSFMFTSKIIDVPDTKPNKEMLKLCDGCNDCIVNCPVRAIHEDWIDAKTCDSYIGENIKWFWYEKMKPDIPKEVVETWKGNSYSLEWGQGIDGYYEIDGWKLKKDGVVISIPHCMECTLQPRCSKSPV
jgi:ferredoxin